MEGEIEEIKTSIAIVKLYKKKRYVYHDCFPKKHDNLAEMKQYVKTVNLFIRDYTPIASLMDIRKVKGSSKKVRDFMSSISSINEDTLCLAVLVNAGISKIIGNIFLKFSSPSYPTRLFTNKDKAITWLEEQTKEYQKSK